MFVVSELYASWSFCILERKYCLSHKKLFTHSGMDYPTNFDEKKLQRLFRLKNSYNSLYSTTLIIFKTHSHRTKKKYRSSSDKIWLIGISRPWVEHGKRDHVVVFDGVNLGGSEHVPDHEVVVRSCSQKTSSIARPRQGGDWQGVRIPRLKHSRFLSCLWGKGEQCVETDHSIFSYFYPHTISLFFHFC